MLLFLLFGVQFWWYLLPIVDLNNFFLMLWRDYSFPGWVFWRGFFCWYWLLLVIFFPFLFHLHCCFFFSCWTYSLGSLHIFKNLIVCWYDWIFIFFCWLVISKVRDRDCGLFCSVFFFGFVGEIYRLIDWSIRLFDRSVNFRIRNRLQINFYRRFLLFVWLDSFWSIFDEVIDN